ncbi:hypothetical protein NDA16_000530 [Ustilago loliicola]|nr:hypothetical protein NDA16_000530 [Ustilago loliicola]
MIASAVRFSAALARQPAVAAVASTATSAGLKTSAAPSMAASTTLRNLDGRLWSKNRLQVILPDASAPAPAAKEPNWSNVAARIRDAKDLAGC